MNASALPGSDDLLEALPHRPPMRLLSRVVALSAVEATSEVDIDVDSLFYLPGRGVAAWTALEYMGQTAALIGLAATLDEGAEQRDGFLLGSRQLDLHVDTFAPGTTVTVHCRAVGDVGTGLASFDGTVLDEHGALLVSGSLSVVRVERPDAPA